MLINFPRTISPSLAMHPLETYLAEIATLRGATKETSGYGVLQNLLNAVGHTLKPKVRRIIHAKNSGAGIPDGDLFTPDQLKQHDEGEIFGELIPARGVIKVKSVGEDIADFAESEQVEKHLAHYGQVLLTNFREFFFAQAPWRPDAPARRLSTRAGRKNFPAEHHHSHLLIA